MSREIIFERFMRKVSIPKNPNECWEWKGTRTPQGYGRYHLTSGKVLAHRLAYGFFHGKKPVNDVLHSCDNPGCVNPAHLREGTNQENVNDKMVRGRHQCFTKIQCKNGHPLEAYVQGRRNCIVCNKEKDARYKERNREKLRAQSKAYYHSNLEQQRERCRENKRLARERKNSQY